MLWLNLSLYISFTLYHRFIFFIIKGFDQIAILFVQYSTINNNENSSYSIMIDAALLLMDAI